MGLGTYGVCLFWMTLIFQGNTREFLLTASGQDANFQVYPLAYTVVDSDNDKAWTRFMEKLERIIADSVNLTLISDRHQLINAVKKRVFPLANHRACIVHLMRNVNSKFRSKGFAKLVGEDGFAWRVGGFVRRLSK